MKSLIRHAAETLALASALVGTFSHAIPGQPGTLDATWATSSPLGAGKVITPVGTAYANANAIALQPDGKVVLAGRCFNGANDDFCALRYNANGTPDASFGSGGTVITPVGAGGDVVTAIAVQPDGKLVLAGYCDNGGNHAFCALRYNAGGTLDASFGSSGTVITPLGISGDYLATALALQPDGKLVLAGQCNNGTNYAFCALRYNANGSLDPSFGSGGSVITPVGTMDDNVTALALQPDGKLLLGGSCINGGLNDFCALRYNANGTPDGSWNGTGKVITSVTTGNDNATAVTLQPDGKVVLAGYCSNVTNWDFCALRYNANGTPDASFGTGGIVTTPVTSSDDVAFALALQPDGKLVLAGQCNNSTNYDFCALRYNANGTLDASFNNNGKVITPVGAGYDQANAIALQPDGKVVLAGYCSNGINNDFCAVRYDGGPFGYKNCSLDIDGDGSVIASTDMLIGTRIALGITGPAVINGITFPATATRNTWPLIRDYLVTQCGMSLVQ